MHNIKKSVKFLIIFLSIFLIKVFSIENDKINFGKFSLNK
jgi:sulfatase modifying factor 1